MTTVLDGAGKSSAKASWVLMRRSKKRTCLGPQVRGQTFVDSGRRIVWIENPDRYWSAPSRPNAAMARSVTPCHGIAGERESSQPAIGRQNHCQAA
jgi:hypothetical protein